MSYHRIAVYSALLLLLASCGIKPSEGDAQTRFTKDVPTNCMELVSFNKTDGQEAELFGVKVYSMSYKANLKFKAQCFWNGHLQALTKTEFNEPTIFGMKFLTQPMWAKKVAQPGEQVEIKGSMRWEKSEKGWRPVR